MWREIACACVLPKPVEACGSLPWGGPPQVFKAETGRFGVFSEASGPGLAQARCTECLRKLPTQNLDVSACVRWPGLVGGPPEPQMATADTGRPWMVEHIEVGTHRQTIGQYNALYRVNLVPTGYTN